MSGMLTEREQDQAARERVADIRGRYAREREKLRRTCPPGQYLDAGHYLYRLREGDHINAGILAVRRAKVRALLGDGLKREEIGAGLGLTPAEVERDAGPLPLWGAGIEELRLIDEAERRAIAEATGATA